MAACLAPPSGEWTIMISLVRPLTYHLSHKSALDHEGQFTRTTTLQPRLHKSIIVSTAQDW